MSLTRIQQLYRQVLLDAAAAPHTWGELGAQPQQLRAVNPTCGDKLVLSVNVAAGAVQGLQADVTGCTICQASAELMIRTVHGKTPAEAQSSCSKMCTLVRDGTPQTGLGDAAVLASVHEFPARVKCALLAWTTLAQLLEE
ncbi:Fe-S cluster assembly sulfur transfer protein SufU [Lacticaseibacillus zhaodongensis]|uniref:Fe-S cluster assembly sulfur transfer protein SufU n=1 Tax=Lacticaseibacillus zhaodongensis TaxID=2668065 RepID=UPI0012D2B204|nr:SUF system NifU family Fe-S cluster assembly protein [Lacticaseibacillus zhaodongensis]